MRLRPRALQVARERCSAKHRNQLKTLAETALVQLPRKSQFKVWTVERPKFQLSVPCTVTWRMKGVSAVVLALVVVALVSRG